MTLEQAMSVGLGHLHPSATRGRSAELEMAGPVVRPARPPDGMNKLERRFRDGVLEPAFVRGAIMSYWREPIKLRLAGRTWYTPDWLVSLPTGEHGIPPAPEIVEVKGFMRDDAAVKLKVAANLYPAFAWWLVTRDKWGWHARRVDSGGIGREESIVPWIHG